MNNMDKNNLQERPKSIEEIDEKLEGEDTSKNENE